MNGAAFRDSAARPYPNPWQVTPPPPLDCLRHSFQPSRCDPALKSQLTLPSLSLPADTEKKGKTRINNSELKRHWFHPRGICAASALTVLSKHPDVQFVQALNQRIWRITALHMQAIDHELSVKATDEAYLPWACIHVCINISCNRF